MKIHTSDMSDSEYKLNALGWKERNKIRLDDIEHEIKKIEVQVKHKKKSWWKKLLRI